MKIAIDASRYGHSEATGVEWYSHYIINGLIPMIKDELVLYSPEKKDIEGVEQRIIPGKKLWTLRHFSRAIAKDKPDILFVPSHTLPIKLAKRNIITIHDAAFRHLRKVYSLRQYHHLNWSTSRAVKRADKVIVPSQATAADLKHFFKCPEDKIAVINHGFSPGNIKKSEADKAMKNSDPFKYFGISPKMKYILFVGRLESKKNLVHLIEAFAKLRENHPDFFLVLAGKRGVGFKEILASVDKHELMKHVIMPGYVTETEKVALYRHCQAFAFVSLYEGFGLPILEGFHHQKPVLASKASCLPEIAKDAAHYCDPYDVDDIAAGLEKIVNDEQYAEELVTRGIERLKDFSWKRAAQKTLEAIYG